MSGRYPFADQIADARAWALGPRGRGAARCAAPLLLFAGALALRLRVLEEHPLEHYVVDNMAFYDVRAKHLLEGANRPNDAFTPPGYPALLAATFAVSRGGYAMIGWLQALFGAATCWLAARLAARIASSDVAGFAVFVAVAVYPPLLLYTALLMTETTFAFLLTLFVVLLLRAVDDEGHRTTAAASAGLALGIAATVRPNALVAIPFVLLFAAALRREGAGRSARAVALAAAVSLLPIGAAAAHNTWVTGRPTLIATNGGINAFLGVCECRGVRMPPGTGAVAFASASHNRRHYEGVIEVDHGCSDEAAFYREALDRVIERPGLLVVSLRKIADGLAVDVDARGDPRSSPYWPGWMGHDDELRFAARAWLVIGLIPAVLYAAFALRGSAGVRPLERRAVLLVSLLFASCLLTLWLFLGDARLRLPFDPIVAAVAAAAWTAVVRAATHAGRARVPDSISAGRAATTGTSTPPEPPPR